MDEHRLIERVVTSLESAARRLQAGGAVRAGFFTDAVAFIRGFADGCHHHKEEVLLFPAMQAAGIPREGGPIGVMLYEHEQARRLTAGIRATADRLDTGDPTAREEMVRYALDYAALLRQHIAKEDRVAFPMAEQVIRGEQHAQLLEAFARAEREEERRGVRDTYVRLAEALEREAAEAPRSDREPESR